MRPVSKLASLQLPAYDGICMKFWQKYWTEKLYDVGFEINNIYFCLRVNQITLLVGVKYEEKYKGRQQQQ